MLFSFCFCFFCCQFQSGFAFKKCVTQNAFTFLIVDQCLVDTQMIHTTDFKNNNIRFYAEEPQSNLIRIEKSNFWKQQPVPSQGALEKTISRAINKLHPQLEGDGGSSKFGMVVMGGGGGGWGCGGGGGGGLLGTSLPYDDLQNPTLVEANVNDDV